MNHVTTEDTKRRLVVISQDIASLRTTISDLISGLSRYPQNAGETSRRIVMETFRLVWRTELFRYLTKEFSYETLERNLFIALRHATMEYRSSIRRTDTDLDDERILNFKLDYLLKATDTYENENEKDSILAIALKYPVVESVEVAFPIGSPTTFSKLNTTEDHED